jgi:hypothetical protein
MAGWEGPYAQLGTGRGEGEPSLAVEGSSHTSHGFMRRQRHHCQSPNSAVSTGLRAPRTTVQGHQCHRSMQALWGVSCPSARVCAHARERSFETNTRRCAPKRESEKVVSPPYARVGAGPRNGRDRFGGTSLAEFCDMYARTRARGRWSGRGAFRTGACAGTREFPLRYAHRRALARRREETQVGGLRLAGPDTKAAANPWAPRLAQMKCIAQF